VVHQLEILLISTRDCLATCKDSVGEGPLDATEDRVGNGSAAELVAAGVWHPRDQPPEVIPIHADAKLKRGGGRRWQETEPLAKSDKANPVGHAFHLKLDVGRILGVIPELERGEELEGELLVAIAMDAPEGEREPDSLSELSESREDPESIEGREINATGVRKDPPLETTESLKHTMGFDWEVWWWVCISTRSVLG